MEAHFPVGTLDEVALDIAEEGHAIGNGTARIFLGEPQVVLEMPGFGAQQEGVETRQLLVQMWRQRFETLAGARLDVGADDEDVDQVARLRMACVLAQSGRITCG